MVSSTSAGRLWLALKGREAALSSGGVRRRPPDLSSCRLSMVERAGGGAMGCSVVVQDAFAAFAARVVVVVVDDDGSRASLSVEARQEKSQIP